MQDAIYQFLVAIAPTSTYLPITFAVSQSHFVSVLHDYLTGVVGR